MMLAVTIALCVLALVVVLPALIIAGRCEEAGGKDDGDNQRRD